MNAALLHSCSILERWLGILRFLTVTSPYGEPVAAGEATTAHSSFVTKTLAEFTLYGFAFPR
jgi:hypothetical protein